MGSINCQLYKVTNESSNMTELASPSKAKRPEFRNINAFSDLPSYRLPAAGWVSILHRVSGALMFLLLPFVIWMFDVSVSSEISFARFTSAFNVGIGFVPGWMIKLVVLALIWAYLHHIIAGLRHLWMDVNHAVSKEFGRSSAIATLSISLGVCLVLGAKLFGLY
jgi:succinate dehydrogenase / fumarate reductase, cytochrome b subunit